MDKNEKSKLDEKVKRENKMDEKVQNRIKWTKLNKI